MPLWIPWLRPEQILAFACLVRCRRRGRTNLRGPQVVPAGPGHCRDTHRSPDDPQHGRPRADRRHPQAGGEEPRPLQQLQLVLFPGDMGNGEEQGKEERIPPMQSMVPLIWAACIGKPNLNLGLLLAFCCRKSSGRGKGQARRSLALQQALRALVRQRSPVHNDISFLFLVLLECCPQACAQSGWIHRMLTSCSASSLSTSPAQTTPKCSLAQSSC